MGNRIGALTGDTFTTPEVGDKQQLTKMQNMAKKPPDLTHALCNKDATQQNAGVQYNPILFTIGKIEARRFGQVAV